MGKNKVSAETLRAAGYTYKMDVLTSAESRELKVGRKVKETVKDDRTGDERENIVTYESRDFDYFFKVLVPADKKANKEAVEARIFHAIKKFYYKGSQMRNIKQIALVEKDVLDTAKYEELQAKVVDTKPRAYVPPPMSVTPNGLTQAAEGYITLFGGPLDGQIHKYNQAFPFFMLQFEDGGKTKAARYVRDYNDPRLAEGRKADREAGLIVGDKTKYNFLNIIE